MTILNKYIINRVRHSALPLIALILSIVIIILTNQGLAINQYTTMSVNTSTTEEIQEINIINTYSTPQVGDTWTVFFKTIGNGLLNITNLNVGEVSFNSIYYKNESLDNSNKWIKLLPGMTDDSIMTYWNYDEGKLISDVWAEGKHTIEFIFGNKVRAYNNAFTNQKTFDLDLDNPVLSYEQNQLNDTTYSALFLFDQTNFSEFKISLPKTANVTSSTINITGQIYPVVYDVGVDIWDLEIGDLSSTYPGNEIVIGSYDSGNNLKIISSTNIDIWEVPGTSPFYNRYRVAIGNFTADLGNEVIVAEDGSDLSVYNSTGYEIWNFTVSGKGRSVAIGNVSDDIGNEILFGTGDTNFAVYLFNSSKNQVWNFSVDSNVNAIVINDINQDLINEVLVVSESGTLYVLNSTGNKIDNFTSLNNVFSDVFAGNLSSDYGNEIAIASENSTLYVLNSTLDLLWSYVIGSEEHILSVTIEEFSNLHEGNEIIFGSSANSGHNKYIYILNSTGSLIHKYLSDSDVRSVTSGILTSSNGTNIYDIVGGTIGGKLHILNYDSFPVNLTLDINSDDNYDWNFSTGDGRFRTTLTLDDTNADISNNLNSYLEGICATAICDIPSTFYALNTEARGYLNLSDINISYDYNATSYINTVMIDSWSRTDSINANETIISEGQNITFEDSSIDMIIKYIKINSGATICGFDKQYINTTIKSNNYCNISSKNFVVNSGTTISKVLWDNMMTFNMPIIINESTATKTYYTDNFDVVTNVTIRNDNIYGATLFTNITANATINDTDLEVQGDIELLIIWGQTVFDITPTTTCPSMDTSLALGFSACLTDTNANGIYDFIEWIQPNLTAGTSTQYTVKAPLNLEVNTTNANVTPDADIWGNEFNYSIYINDSDGDNVNVTLWVTINDIWTNKGTVTVTGEGLAEFNDTLSTKEWTLTNNKFKFEYFDFNSTGYVIHSKINTTEVSGPTIIKHNVTVSDVFGNDSMIYRENDSGRIEVIFNDTTLSAPVSVSEIGCSFYTTQNGQNLLLSNTTNVNNTGYCSYDFDPNNNYSVGPQIWNISIDPQYYNLKNIQNYTINIKGNVSINIINPEYNGSVLRNTTTQFSAQLRDEYNINVTSSSINTTEYICIWYFNNTEIGSSALNSGGICNYNWIPPCAYVNLEDYTVNVTINNTVPVNYTLKNNDSYEVRLTENLLLTIDKPYNNQQFYKGSNLDLNISVTDGCGTQEQNTYNVSWYSVNKIIVLNITETLGANITDRPVIIKAINLETSDINLGSWNINKTKLKYINNEIESVVSIHIQNTSFGQTNLNNNSEIVFLINMSANESKIYKLFSDEINDYPDNTNYKVSLIRNNDFSNNNSEYWTGAGTATYTDNISIMQIYALENTINVSQELYEPINTEYVKIRYRQNNLYQNESANVSLYFDGYQCNLENFTDSFDTTWKTQICNDININGTTNITISVQDEGNGAATQIQIDYLCISDALGTCINSMINSEISLDYDTKRIIGSDNITWSTLVNHSVGAQKLVVSGIGPYYIPQKRDVNVNIFGWSRMSNLSITSSSCSEDGLKCFLNSTVNINCNVSDANLSTGIFNQTVSFYDNITYLGTSNTNKFGIATYNWINSTEVTGDHPIMCNISDSPNIYYNTTLNTSYTVNISFSNDKTTGELITSTTYIPAENITYDRNDTINISVLINNTGNFDMFNPQIVFLGKTGFTYDSNKCNSILSSDNCTTYIILNVTQEAELGNNTLNFTLTWDNPETTFYNKSIIIDVWNTTFIKIIDTQINPSEISYGSTKTLGNFTISAFGNTPLFNVTINTTGGNSSIINDWLNYSQNNFDINSRENATVNIDIAVPENISLVGSYWTYIIINDTGTPCDGDYDSCSDMMLLNITIKDIDWKVTVLEYTVEAGKGGPTEVGSFKPITILNGLNQNLSFIINITGNGSSNVTTNITINDTVYEIVSGDNYTIPANLTGILDIYYNVSNADIGKYEINITITSIDTNLVPLFVTEILSLDVSALSISIIYPTGSSQAGPFNSSDEVTIQANADYNEQSITNATKINWSVNVSGVPCLYLGTTIFNFPYYSPPSYDYGLTCNVPFIEGNPINNTIEVTGYYYTDSGIMTFTAEQVDAIRYDDITPPSINSITLNESDPEGNVNWDDNISLINVQVNVTDNTGISHVWTDVNYPNGTVTQYDLTLVGGDTWTFDLPIFNQIGDYKIDISANDTAHNLIATTVNTTMGYFDVYTDLDFSGIMKDSKDNVILGDFKLYKNGTDWAIHDFNIASNGTYNWDIHKRVYDIKIYNLWDEQHSIKLKDVNISKIMENQHNDSNATNVTNVIRLDTVTINDTLDIGQITLPTTAPDAGQDTLLAIGLDIPYINYTSAEITLNYTQGLLDIGHAISEDYLRVYKCSEWNMTTRSCATDFFKYGDVSLDTNLNTITFNITSTSAYAIAEWCRGTTCGYIASPDTGGPTSSAGGSSGGQNSMCGNNVCETGENILNCPLDCLKTTEYFSVDSNINNIFINPGENKTYETIVNNLIETELQINVSVDGEIIEHITFDADTILLLAHENKSLNINVTAEDTAIPGTYYGNIIFRTINQTIRVPVALKITSTSNMLQEMDIDIKLITKKIRPNEDIKFNIIFSNLAKNKGFNVSLAYIIKNSKTEEIIKVVNDTIFLTESITLRKIISMEDALDVGLGEYYIEVLATYENKTSKSSLDTFEVVLTFWETTTGGRIKWSVLLISLIVALYYGRIKYIKYKHKNERYILPVNFSKLPQESNDAFCIGKISETNKKAYFNPKDLTTHLLVAGSTGSGKSVAASVIIEEALEHNIPVVVFDPTVQWTGFMKPCKDEFILNKYTQFGMNPRFRRSYKGIIEEVTDPNIQVDFKKYMNPGEITVFTLNKLKTGEYDIAIRSIIKTLFAQNWEESTELKMIVVLDEVHRLLEKYGGSGGYSEVEKACREFRKWGIGLIMISQVSSDFKEAISGNVLTEIQLNTKSLSDIEKWKNKYGLDFANRISRQGIGVGMIQNPKYNNGKPWFISFRPTWHSPHKILNDDLEKYKDFSTKMDGIEADIEELKAKGININDFELELKLAKNKLKQGRFRIAEIYISSLMEHLKRYKSEDN